MCLLRLSCLFETALAASCLSSNHSHVTLVSLISLRLETQIAVRERRSLLSRTSEDQNGNKVSIWSELVRDRSNFFLGLLSGSLARLTPSRLPFGGGFSCDFRVPQKPGTSVFFHRSPCIPSARRGPAVTVRPPGKQFLQPRCPAAASSSTFLQSIMASSYRGMSSTDDLAN